MILFVLVMLVDLVAGRTAPRDEPEAPPIEAEDDLAALKREIEELRRQLAKLKEETRQIVVAVESRAAPEKEARLVEELNDVEREAAALLSQKQDLRMRIEKARDADAESRRKIAEREKTRRILQARLDELKNKKGITLIPERGEFKAPVFIVCGRGGVEFLRPIAKTTRRKWYSYDDMEAGIEDELSILDRTTHTVILLIRPSGISRIDALVQLVKKLGFSYGRDPLEEDVEVDLAKGGEGLR